MSYRFRHDGGGAGRIVAAARETAGVNRAARRATAPGMTLVAIAAAQLLADDVDAWGMPRLRAMLPIAGMTLLEQQAEQARAVGVDRLLLLVDGVPPAMAEACDRIRARGLPVDLVREARDIIRHAAGAEQLLLVADGLVSSMQPWQAMAGTRGAALLVTEDALVTQDLERVDAATRWAGLAMLSGEAIRELADAPADWDPQLLMLRRAIQDGAPRLLWDSGQFVTGDIALVRGAAAMVAVEQRLVGRRGDDEVGIGARWLLGPLTRLFARPLLGAQGSGRMARAATLIAALAALGAILAGHGGACIALGLLAAFGRSIGDFVARFRPEGRMMRWLASGGIGAQLLAFAALERGASAGSAAELIGSGGIGASAMLLLAEWSARRDARRVVLDLPVAWLGFAALAPLLPRDAIASLICALALAIYLLPTMRKL
jgi:hypothetical protein